MLLNTLVYRVEQILLIDRRSGLLMQHVTSDPRAVEDPEMVSGMLTAIRDFSHDSFRVSEDDALDALEVGDLTVWVEQGPYAILAAVIRGTPPRELRTALQEAIERVHAFHGDALRNFNGDAGSLENVRPTLEDCLQSQYQRETKKPSRLLWAIVGVLVLATAAWLYSALQERARWSDTAPCCSASTRRSCSEHRGPVQERPARRPGDHPQPLKGVQVRRAQ